MVNGNVNSREIIKNSSLLFIEIMVLIGCVIMKKFLKAFLMCFIFIILALTILSALVYFDVVSIDFIDDIFISTGLKGHNRQRTSKQDTQSTEDLSNELSDVYDATAVNAEEYFKEKSTIISSTNAKDSKVVLNEKEVYDTLASRGFQEEIITVYSMDGEYQEADTITSSSSTKHPMYEMYYVTKKGDIWDIIIVNNVIIANPISYNLETEKTVQVLISETNTLMSYDNVTNKFYETIPNASEIKIKKVNQINSSTLEKITKEELDAL